MNQEGFDHIIKDKLKGYNAGFPPTDVWEAFEQASVQFENKSSDDQFDNVVRDAVADQKVNYNSAHWKLMKAQLKISEERKRTVYISKILEIAAIFLIFITAFKWPVYKYPVYPIKANVSTHKSEYAAQEKLMPKLKNNITPTNTSINQLVSGDLRADVVKFHDLTDNMTVDEFLANVGAISPTSSLFLTKAENALEADVAATDVMHESEAVYGQDSRIADSENIDFNLNIDNVNGSEMSISPLPLIGSNELASEYPMMVPMEFVANKEKSKYYLGVTASADVNLINTPFDKIYSIASYNKEALNNSFGMTLSKKKGMLELETGAIYTKRAYQPEAIREKLENDLYYTEKTFSKIEFDIVNVPLNIKYHFINQPKWSAFLVAGAALNLILNANYAISEVQSLHRPAPGEYIAPESRLQEKPFIRGLLNNDNLKDNYFATLSFGFGIEKKLSQSTSLYLQPSYHRQVLSADIGIGPNKDKIHTSSLTFGVKTIIN